MFCNNTMNARIKNLYSHTYTAYTNVCMYVNIPVYYFYTKII